MPVQYNVSKLSRRTTLKALIGGSIGAKGLPAVFDQATAATTTSDWPMFQYDAANSGFHPDATGPKQDVGVRWSRIMTSPEGQPETSRSIIDPGPVISNGTVYIGDSEGYMYALDRLSGDQQWEFKTNGSVTSTAAVQEGRVFFLAEDDFLYAVDTSSGDELWKFDWGRGATMFNSPTVVDGRVFFANSDPGTLFAIGAETGDEQWRFETNGANNSTPAVVDGTVYFGSDDGHLYALDAATGTEIWSHPIGAEVASPTVSDGLVYVGGGQSVYAITTGGEQEWRSLTDDSVVASPAVAGGTVYVGSTDGNLYAFDDADGDERWRFSTNLDVWSSAAVADGVVYVGSLDDTVYAVDAEDGTERWSFTTGDSVYSSPAVVDGIAYIGSRDGRVYAFESGQSGNLVPLEGLGSEHAKQDCPDGEDSYWHWVLTRGGPTPLQDGAKLTVTFEGGLEETFNGYFPGAGSGSVHFETSRDGSNEVQGAEVSFEGGGDHPLLVLNHGTCLSPDENLPSVIPEQEETAGELDYWQVDFGEGANPPIPPHYWPDDGMWALGNAEDGVTQNVSGKRKQTDGQLADVDIIGGEFDFDDEGDPESVTVTFEIDDDGAPRDLHLALFAMPGPFEMDEIDDQVLINTISDEFEGGEEGELTIPLQ
ncbi:hypothetical protein Har1130_18045 [Haloarcula sp. CBA1130]|uniref:outer membrane protein assembly factor BamB family protein n=1 Tax=unclassified Haloarcula TaxID=2624677 RepID=UPI001245AA5F|nr:MULTISPECIES: PQQ-binding-like beta-propeller repeat protein [unclassified Haloarcula]KAA9396552.1 hypothetical protein Har1130_18045 [Haloarcula sp. CBA1130]KAA9397589.1 hypothetical protein Har1129_04755 [Haloarcula sp. CBA1129]